jgi:hypothetical protein
MLNHFHQHGGVVALHAVVKVQQRPVQQAHAPFREFRLESSLGNPQRRQRHIQPRELLERPLACQRGQQCALAAAEINHAPCAQRLQRRRDCADALLLQAQWAFQSRFKRQLIVCGWLFGRRLVAQDACECLLDQRRAVVQVAQDDALAGGMVGQPLLTLTDEFVHLRLADVVVLRAVQHGNQDIQVAQQLVQPNCVAQAHPIETARAPLREPLVQRDFVRLHRVAQRLEQLAQQALAAATRQRRQECLQRQGCSPVRDASRTAPPSPCGTLRSARCSSWSSPCTPAG